MEVSEELGIDQSVIFRLVKRFQDGGNVSRRYSIDPPQVATPNEYRCLLIELRSELRDLSDDDDAVNKTYESCILKGESSSDESDEEKYGNI
ncbi:hypothetical protein TNCV_2150891 [Trichonephila clavipes]|nr:hypothetical protein TNCV_2150891 [Trichonephila clavipes]